MNRKKNLEHLKSDSFDVCIIGAGASGAGVALDAALRGFKVALIEKHDFASETSSKSTKLIHGGVRYLEQAVKQLDPGHLKQMIHGLSERKYLLENAPFLCKPLGIITPVKSWIEGLYYTIGLKMYGLFALNDAIPKAKWLSKKQTLEFSPDLNSKIHSSVMYYDGQLDDSKYTLALVQSASKIGARVANYLELFQFHTDSNGKIIKALVKDTISNEKFEIKSKLFINCTGPFADAIRILANPEEVVRIKPSKGAHIVISKEFFRGEKAMLIPKTKDGRLVFVIPFKSEVMVGTTDTPYENIDKEPYLENEEIAFLLDTLTPFLKKMPKKEDIKSGFGGIRPLISGISKNQKETKSLLRDHEVEVDQKSGLVSLLGGKWTTYRLMAQDTLDEVCKIFDVQKECSTKNFKLFGAQNQITEPDLIIADIDLELKNHLKETYGDQINEVLELIKIDPNLKERISSKYPFIKAQIVYACHHEMITKPRDFLARRIRLEILDWTECLAVIKTVSEIMAKELEWEEEKLIFEIFSYQNLLNDFKSRIA